MSRVYLAAGEAVFAHECERKRHSVTVGWRPGDPAVDENSLPPCPHCGKIYERVAACAGKVPHTLNDKGSSSHEGGDHECHPVVGHVERSDDHTKGLVEVAEPDPASLRARRLADVRWVIEQKRVIEATGALLEADRFPTPLHKEDCQLTHQLAKDALAAWLEGAGAKDEG